MFGPGGCLENTKQNGGCASRTADLSVAGVNELLQKNIPVTLMLSYVMAQFCDMRPIASFCLSICLRKVYCSREMLQSKEEAYSFDKTTHESCAIVCQSIRGILRIVRYSCGRWSQYASHSFSKLTILFCVSLEYQSGMIPTIWWPFVVLSNEPRMSTAMNSRFSLVGKSLTCCVRILLARKCAHSWQLFTLVHTSLAMCGRYTLVRMVSYMFRPVACRASAWSDSRAEAAPVATLDRLLV